jgi:hypothetical protein
MGTGLMFPTESGNRARCAERVEHRRKNKRESRIFMTGQIIVWIFAAKIRTNAFRSKFSGNILCQIQSSSVISANLMEDFLGKKDYLMHLIP